MGIPIRRLQSEVDSSDFALYQAFNNIDPFENYRADYAAACISQVMAQIHGAKGTKLQDFMVKWDNPPSKKTKAEQIKMIMDAFVSKHNQRVGA